MRGHCESYKDTEPAMVWPHRKMEEGKVMKKVTDFRRARGRPKSQWEEQVLEDIKRLRIHNWRGKIRHWKSWKRITKEAKTSKAL